MTDHFGLKPDVIARINNVFAGFPEIGKVVLYGSRAMGTYRPGSDIDLTLVAAEGYGISLQQLLALDEKLDDLLLPYTFDLSVLAEIDNPGLVDHIARVGQVFYLKDECIRP